MKVSSIDESTQLVKSKLDIMVGFLEHFFHSLLGKCSIVAKSTFLVFLLKQMVGRNADKVILNNSEW